ncbi:S-adenosylmethionine synthetase [Acidilobus saccharovorans 345-15]|uniref:S-adenosylmethionine synthase n=1 Tax=Acidilobus saccharovorans (strain DSM 16705 / JCM 18335 / VKM B-2471 / 345-15) TaxID=666510 RepID=D9Q2M8_ACIS3|nr:methionine adenosyltransferase [Acidilobus saccharovorans]ADL19566.1 S-adenosylmethionine synthetase [Acidilobus saccharovorans 345-15]
MTRNIVVRQLSQQPIEDTEVELVERKGLGHPDYISDAVAEEASRQLSAYYKEHFGTIMHHNLDKVLLVGGQASPKWGGGDVITPIYIIVSGRATTEVRTSSGIEEVPVGRIIIKAVKDWISRNLRFLDPEVHVVVDYKVGKGSADLRGIFESRTASYRANDTSFGAGFAPLSTLERLVFETERLLNSKEFKSRVPASGEDVKVMGLRRGKSIELTVADAIVSRFVNGPEEYMSVKEEIKDAVLNLASKLAPGYDVKVYINSGDIPEEEVFYLTVTGTSAEHGDDGATGRGNRVNGLITPMRPMSLEAAAGKNPVTHVGKIYNVAAMEIAQLIYAKVPNIREVYVRLLGQIGRPIDDPLIADVSVIPDKGAQLTSDSRQEIASLIDEYMSRLLTLSDRFLKGEVQLY